MIFIDSKACEIAYNAAKDEYYDIIKFGTYDYTSKDSI